jgi:hypothetical protein
VCVTHTGLRTRVDSTSLAILTGNAGIILYESPFIQGQFSQSWASSALVYPAWVVLVVPGCFMTIVHLCSTGPDIPSLCCYHIGFFAKANALWITGSPSAEQTALSSAHNLQNETTGSQCPGFRGLGTRRTGL